jgi:hypothetical protein
MIWRQAVGQGIVETAAELAEDRNDRSQLQIG